jgi:hypothetical protein
MTTATPPPAGDDVPGDPAVDPADAGFPDSPDLADGDEEFVDEESGRVDEAGDGLTRGDAPDGPPMS